MIRKINLALAMGLIGFCCAHQKTVKVEFPDGTLRRQCFVPVEFRVDDDFSEEDRATIVRGFLHWNKVLGREVFRFGGTYNLAKWPRHDFLPVTKEDGDVPWCGLTRTTQMFNKCTYAHDVILRVNVPACYDDGAFETVVRHEAGHVLGLGHDESKKALMFWAVQGNQKHPRPITPKEREDARRRLPNP